MEKYDTFKSGFVTIVGRPNVGKSTLLNALIGHKISIVSPIPQTTRYQIRGILNLPQSQIVFVDTPGIHAFKDKLTKHLNVIAKGSLEGCDLLMYVTDVSRRFGEEEEQVMSFVVNQKMKTFIVFNKIDLGPGHIDTYVAEWKKKIESKKIDDPALAFLPVSAKTETQIDTLKKLLADNLPDQPAFYEKNSLTDFPLKFRIADIVREKLFLRLAKELPHSLAVEVEKIKEKKQINYIRVNLYINRPSQKRIVIGTAGEILKAVGQDSRKEIEQILGKKVYLDIWVKVLADWQNKQRVLQELGYWWA
jgi:GTP-binding protein Era